jgi:predicted transcriptional regulator
MAEKSKTREITITDDKGTFNAILRRFSGGEDYDFESLAVLRKILSNEKARLMHTIKIKSPKSIYELAKVLGRDFRSVSEDIKLLQKFGFIEMIAEKSGNRDRLRPILVIDSVHIYLKI